MHKFRKKLLKKYKNGDIIFNVFSTLMQITLAAEAAVCTDCGEFDDEWYQTQVDIYTAQLGMEFADINGCVYDKDWDDFRDLEVEFITQVLIPEGYLPN